MERVEITKELIEKCFVEYNENYFNNKLPMPKFIVRNWKKDSLGGFLYNANGKGESRLRISKYPNINGYRYFTKELLKDVIIHEMVHYYICVLMKRNYLFPPHGLRFRLVCLYLRLKYGIVVTLNYPRRYEKTPSSVWEWLKAQVRFLYYDLYLMIL